MPDPDIVAAVTAAVEAARAKKGFQIVALDVAEMTSLADSFVLCSGANPRQVGAIVDNVAETLRGEGRRPLHVEGESACEWVLMDYGDFVIHVFSEERRSYYALDRLWSSAPRLEVGTVEPGDEPAAR
jgi:ribosome-associated protein